MSVADLHENDEVRGLIARGLQVGVLTHAESATATAEVGLEETDVEELHSLFERCEIELVEEIDPATASLYIERALGKRTRGKAPLDLKPEMTTDSLQLFLKDIGKVRLLTAEEEVALAKRIERGDLDAHGVFLGSVMSSETTAAAAGRIGRLRWDPMAMLPFNRVSGPKRGHAEITAMAQLAFEISGGTLNAQLIALAPASEDLVLGYFQFDAERPGATTHTNGFQRWVVRNGKVVSLDNVYLDRDEVDEVFK